ncbi:molybdenum cofactor biosynthesis protein MoaE [Chloroflexota bacterium]
MVEIIQKPISPELIVNKIKTDSSGCVVTYVGLIRKHSQDKAVLSVEYKDAKGTAANTLQEIASEIRQNWPVENLAICHRTGKLKVGDINLVVAIASAHRKEGFAACQYAIDQFKHRLPTQKKETYEDGSVRVEGE